MSLLSAEMVERLRQLELFSRLRVEGAMAGENRSRRIGQGMDFARHRQYFPGDNLRDIDWRILGRTDRLVVKQYEEQTNADMTVVLDTSGSMGYAGQSMSKMDFAVRCAAVLTYLMHLQRDSFSLVAFGASAADTVGRGSGRRHLRRVFEKLVALRPAGETRFAECFAQVELRLKRRGLVVVLSDFMDEPGALARAMARLRMASHDVIAFQVFDPSERDLEFVDFTRFRDLETGEAIGADPLAIRTEYRRQFERHQLAMKEACLAHAIDHVLLAVADEYDEAIGDYLRRRAALLT